MLVQVYFNDKGSRPLTQRLASRFFSKAPEGNLSKGLPRPIVRMYEVCAKLGYQYGLYVECLMPEKKLVSFRLPEPLITELKAKALEEGVSVTELISRFSRQGLNLSTEERLAALEKKLSVLQGAELSFGSEGPECAEFPGLSKGEAQCLSITAKPQDQWTHQVNQLQLRLDKLVHCIQNDIADIASEVTKLQMQLKFETQLK